ncbi:MFS transporter, partial [Burkholderia pyrrocinia]
RKLSQTGRVHIGLYALAIASLVAAVAALFARTHRRSDPPRGLPADESFTNATMLRHAEH